MQKTDNFKLIVEDFFSQDECEKYINLGEEIGFELSKIRTKDGEITNTDIRNNGRVILDDSNLAEELFKRLEDQLPKQIDEYTLKGLNEQLKIYRYEVGQEFKMHKDAPFVRNENERSFLTMLIYLNNDYEGGETFFLDGTVKGSTGQCVVFRQSMAHAGLKVKSGVKYAIRTDVMYVK